MKRKKPARERAKRFVIDYKSSHPCVDCDTQYPFYCMEFDHVRGRKEFELWKAGDTHTNIDKITLEISKCDMVCRNCHAKRTFIRNLPTNDELQNDTLQAPEGWI